MRHINHCDAFKGVCWLKGIYWGTRGFVYKAANGIYGMSTYSIERKQVTSRVPLTWKKVRWHDRKKIFLSEKVERFCL